MSYDWVHPQAEVWADETLRLEAHTGHSAESLISRMLRIGHLEPAPGGSRILCIDPCPTYWDVQNALLTLPATLQRAFAARYLLVVKEDGSTWTNRERANKIEVSLGTFKDRLVQSKRRIAPFLPKVPGRRGMKNLGKRLIASVRHKW